jgi:hypothetical protein
MAKKKLTPQKHQARAAANGYRRGTHREKDSMRDQDEYVDDTIELQERALNIYKTYVN